LADLFILSKPHETSANIRAAFKEIYQRDQDELEKEWKSYLPIYASKDWKWNKLTNYNFKIAEKLIASVRLRLLTLN
jgi:hypothetical protein